MVVVSGQKNKNASPFLSCWMQLYNPEKYTRQLFEDSENK